MRGVDDVGGKREVEAASGRAALLDDGDAAGEVGLAAFGVDGDVAGNDDHGGAFLVRIPQCGCGTILGPPGCARLSEPAEFL